MSNQQADLIVLALVILTVGAWIALDVWLYHQGGVEATISRVTRRWIDSCPSLFVGAIFALGIFVGHVWLQH
jgi:hypothetical protein